MKRGRSVKKKEAEEISEKGQVTLGTIATYACVVVAIVAVTGTLVYLGIIEPSKFFPDRCIFGKGLSCDVEVENAEKKVYLEVGNGFGEDIVDVTIKIKKDGADICTEVTGSSQIDNGHAEIYELECVKEIYRGKYDVELKYRYKGKPIEHTMTGELKVTKKKPTPKAESVSKLLGGDFCEDSDGGKDYYVKGTTTDASSTVEDICHNEFELAEAYCDGDFKKWDIVDCEYGCKDGACLKEPLNETNATHLACVGDKCVSVQGAGTDLCKTNLDCNKTNLTKPPTGGPNKCRFDAYSGQIVIPYLYHEADVESESQCKDLGEYWKAEACNYAGVLSLYLFYKELGGLYFQIPISSGDCCCTISDARGVEYCDKCVGEHLLTIPTDVDDPLCAAEGCLCKFNSHPDYETYRRSAYVRNVYECQDLGVIWKAEACQDENVYTNYLFYYGLGIGQISIPGTACCCLQKDNNIGWVFFCSYNRTQCKESAESLCEDSDGGINYYVNGTALLGTDPWGSRAGDFCSGNTLTERFCDQFGNIGLVRYDCMSEGKECGDSRCIVIGQEPVCSDSDSGIDYYTHGTAAIGLNMATDFCLGNILHEKFCNEFGNVDSIEYDCTQDGTECALGMCLGEGSPPCLDSDGGLNYYTPGTATLGISFYTSSKADYCSGNILKEAFCNEFGNVDSVQYDCMSEGKECGDNRCIVIGQEPVCSDSDGGIDYYTKGLATLGITAGGDFCIDNILTERFCNEFGNIGLVKYDCTQDGTQCASGECLGEGSPPCIDPDGGINYYTKSTVTQGTSSAGDFCLGSNSNILTERFCTQFGTIGLVQYDCMSEGKECGDSRCIVIGQPPVCSDSDGGINYYTKGIAIIGNSERGEFCSGNILNEAFCNEFGNADSIEYDCMSENKQCTYGKCIG